jgi:hypothetical protein
MPSRKQGSQLVCLQTKNPNLVTFGRPWDIKCWYIFGPFRIVYGNLIFLGPIGIICGFAIFLPVLVCCTMRNLATLVEKPLASSDSKALFWKLQSPT